MKIRLAGKLQSDSIVDGEGLRAVVWTQGCPHKCVGCHNPKSHDMSGGFEITTEELKEELSRLSYLTGITLSGGEPFMQPEACKELSDYVKSIGLNVWCYSGFTFEQLISIGKYKKEVLDLLETIDVLVDGKFELANKTLNMRYRGSTNQRIIDVKMSLQMGEIVEIHEYDKSISGEFLYQKPETLFI